MILNYEFMMFVRGRISSEKSIFPVTVFHLKHPVLSCGLLSVVLSADNRRAG